MQVHRIVFNPRKAAKRRIAVAARPPRQDDPVEALPEARAESRDSLMLLCGLTQSRPSHAVRWRRRATQVAAVSAFQGTWLDAVASGGLSLLCQNDVGGVLRGNVLGAPITEAGCIDIGEAVFARAEEHRGDRKVHLIDKPRA